MNTTGTNASNCAETVPLATLPDAAAIKTHLVRLRRARGFNSIAGRRCSNILEMLDSLPDEEGDQRTNLLRGIATQAAELDAELAKLKALAN